MTPPGTSTDGRSISSNQPGMGGIFLLREAVRQWRRASTAQVGGARFPERDSQRQYDFLQKRQPMCQTCADCGILVVDPRSHCMGCLGARLDEVFRLLSEIVDTDPKALDVGHEGHS